MPREPETSAPSADVPAPWSAVGVTPDGRRTEVEGRLAWVRDVVASRGESALLVTSRASFAWLTLGGLNHVVVGSEGGAVPLLVGRDGAWALAPINEAARVAEEELLGLPIEVRSVPWDDPAALAAEARRLAGAAPLREDVVAGDLVGRRSVLNAVEHDRLRSLASDAALSLDRALGDVSAGDTEDVIAGRVAGSLLEHGIRAPVLLVAADDRIRRYRHPLPTALSVRGRVMVVIVAERWGLHAATTRFVDLEPRSAEIAHRDAAVDRVLGAMRDASRVGATLDDVLTAAREAYRETGFADEWRLHHQGGTIGYAPRERIAVPGDRTVLQHGMAVAWNPSITGTKREATMLITAGEAEQLAG